jgi:hypothetical protein
LKTTFEIGKKPYTPRKLLMGSRSKKMHDGSKQFRHALKYFFFEFYRFDILEDDEPVRRYDRRLTGLVLWDRRDVFFALQTTNF